VCLHFYWVARFRLHNPYQSSPTDFRGVNLTLDKFFLFLTVPIFPCKLGTSPFIQPEFYLGSSEFAACPCDGKVKFLPSFFPSFPLADYSPFIRACGLSGGFASDFTPPRSPRGFLSQGPFWRASLSTSGYAPPSRIANTPVPH